MRAESKHWLPLRYPGRVTSDQGIVKIPTALHFFIHMFFGTFLAKN